MASQRDRNIAVACVRRVPGHLFSYAKKGVTTCHTQFLSLSQLLQLQYSLLSPSPKTLVDFDSSKYRSHAVDAQELSILHLLKDNVLLRFKFSLSFKLHFLS